MRAGELKRGKDNGRLSDLLDNAGFISRIKANTTISGIYKSLPMHTLQKTTPPLPSFYFPLSLSLSNFPFKKKRISLSSDITKPWTVAMTTKCSFVLSEVQLI